MSEAPSRIIYTPHPRQMEAMTSEQIRAAFVVSPRTTPGRIAFTFTDLDRMAIALVDASLPAQLTNDHETGSEFFLARRELGAINIGRGGGVVRVDGATHEVGPGDCIYVGMGSRLVMLESPGEEPAHFFLVSCPAHHAHPTAVIPKVDANPLSLGSGTTANQRTIRQCIHAAGIRSCQLVMGYTDLAEGSVWNTMPPHTHSRRSEIYFYFDLGENIVAHFLGEPGATRHVWVHNEQAVLSPSWSIHCGCGTGRYKFIWAMAGENQSFDDMDKIDARGLR